MIQDTYIIKTLSLNGGPKKKYVCIRETLIPVLPVLPSCIWIEEDEIVKLDNFQLHSQYALGDYKHELKHLPWIEEELVKPDVIKTFYAYINDF